MRRRRKRKSITDSLRSWDQIDELMANPENIRTIWKDQMKEDGQDWYSFGIPVAILLLTQNQNPGHHQQ